MVIRALEELRAGRKVGHWMWFVFPQLAGLGSSPTARRYAISGADEARAYLADPGLGARLRECTAALLDRPPGSRIETVLGPIDSLKLRSSMTLFATVDVPDGDFTGVLARDYGGVPDPVTLRLLSG